MSEINETGGASGLLKLENQFCFAVYSAAHAVMRTYRPLLEALGLTYPQYLVMLILWESPEQTVGGIAERMLLDSSTLTPLLKRLEATGLIRRRRNPDNERQLIVTLTDEGRALRARAEAIPEAILCASGQDVANLLRLRDQLVTTRDSFAAANDAEIGASTAGAVASVPA